MDFDYVTEKAKLKKKLVILLAVAVVFTAIIMITTPDAGFFPSLFIGIAMGLFFYIPGRIKSHLGWGWFGAIVVVIIYYGIFLFLAEKLGSWIVGISLLLPIADIGYSIYRIMSAKKDQ